MNGVYLLHFSRKYKHAAHYIGWAKYIDERIQHHVQGTGAKLTAVVSDAGIDLIKARVWEGKGKDFERRLKKQHKPQDFCPLCSGEKANKRMKG